MTFLLPPGIKGLTIFDKKASSWIIERVLNKPLGFPSTENQSKFSEPWFRTKKKSLIRNSQKEPPELICKKDALKNMANFTGKHLCLSLLIKLQAFRPATLLKRHSNTGVFQWILRNLFWRTSANDCFWKELVQEKWKVPHKNATKKYLLLSKILRQRNAGSNFH